MAQNYAVRDLDLRVSSSPELKRGTRLLLILAGLLLIPLAFPVGFIAMVFAGGGHESPFDGGVVEFIFGLAMLAIPVLMIALGIACLSCTNRWRLRLVASLALGLLLDLALAFVALRIPSEPKPPRYEQVALRQAPESS